VFGGLILMGRIICTNAGFYRLVLGTSLLNFKGQGFGVGGSWFW